MPIDRRTLMGGALGATLAASTARAQQWGDPPTPAAGDPKAPTWPPAESFKLWPGRAPGARASLPTPNDTMNGPAHARELWLRGIADPIVGVFRPARPDGRAVLVIPGGGYRFVSVHNEGIDVAATLTPHGITCFVLAYRLPSEGWDDQAHVPLQDAQRAMRLIRARAATWGVDPKRLGTVGFSAGGHLSGSLAVGHGDRVYAPVDDADAQPARPAYAGLIYPGIRGSPVLVGAQPDDATAARYRVDARIDKDTPPLFLLHAFDDGTTPVGNSLALLAAASAAKVPCEVHLLERGGHGFGGLHLAPDLPGRLWPDLFARWTAKH